MHTNEELSAMRDAMLEAHEEFHYMQENPPEYREPKITCDGCSKRLLCDLVFDLYNTDGDCLDEHLAATPDN